MATRRTHADEDGNDIPEVKPDSDLGQIMAFMEWGRRRGFVIGPTIQVGETIVQIADPKARIEKTERVPDTSIWASHGHED